MCSKVSSVAGVYLNVFVDTTFCQGLCPLCPVHASTKRALNQLNYNRIVLNKYHRHRPSQSQSAQSFLFSANSFQIIGCPRWSPLRPVYKYYATLRCGRLPQLGSFKTPSVRDRSIIIRLSKRHGQCHTACSHKDQSVFQKRIISWLLSSTTFTHEIHITFFFLFIHSHSILFSFVRNDVVSFYLHENYSYACD